MTVAHDAIEMNRELQGKVIELQKNRDTEYQKKIDLVKEEFWDNTKKLYPNYPTLDRDDKDDPFDDWADQEVRTAKLITGSPKYGDFNVDTIDDIDVKNVEKFTFDKEGFKVERENN